MGSSRIGATGLPLNVLGGLTRPNSSANSASGVATQVLPQAQGLTNVINLAAGETWIIPSGGWMIQPGPYTCIQYLDPVLNAWRNIPTPGTAVKQIDTDGVNYRLANTTGCPIGATIIGEGTTGTNGIGATATGVTIAASAGGSVWSPIVGGAVSTTVVTGTNGVGYTYPPIIVIDAPPPGGLQATATCVLTAGAVTPAGITITNQGAGYASAPTLTFIPDPRETGPTTPVVATVTLTGTGGLTGLVVTNHGTALTSVPTLTITGTTATATVIMNFTVTGFATGSTVGAGYPGNTPIISVGNNIVATSVRTNPLHTNNVTFPRPARIVTAATATTILTTGSIIEDAGLGIQAVPLLVPAAFCTTTATPTATVGGTTDSSYVQGL